MNNYVQVTVNVSDTELSEQLIAMLFALNFYGFEEKENELIAYVGEEEFRAAEVEQVCNLLDLPFTTQVIAQQNWNALWESNFEPVVVDDFCTIRADFHPPSTATKHEIIITPKMSFGTGHHATTYLMIKQMSELDFNGKSVADFGTGTGILAIMAEKLGATEVLAIDHDDWCIENSSENIERNKSTTITLQKEDHFVAGRQFDIILANINRNVIVDNLDSLANGITNSGYLLLSGLLQTDESAVVAAFQETGLTFLRKSERNNWICLLFKL